VKFGINRMSRRSFAALLGGLPFLYATSAAAKSGVGDALEPGARRAVEVVLRGLVERNVVPGVSYSIGNATQLLAKGAFGLRVVQSPVRMTAATRCALASVSKQFAATAIFVLQQRGALSVDAPLSIHLPDYKYADKMTLRHVLTMRAGIPADDEFGEAPIDGVIDDSTLIANLNKHPLDFPPGRYYAYSNCAYDIVGAVIARVTGKSCSQFIQETILTPLGMTSSYVLGARKDPNFAEGYSPTGNAWKPEPATPADRTFASGNLVSTVSDMQRWNRSLLNATILSRNSLREMFTVPQASEREHVYYGSAWFVEPHDRAIWHGGALSGYGTVNMLIPQSACAVTLLSNSKPGDRWRPQAAARDVYNAARLGPPLPPLAPVVFTTVPHA
jgi:D-alanyl-D-alanine carboxypeptidase